MIGFTEALWEYLEDLSDYLESGYSLNRREPVPAARYLPGSHGAPRQKTLDQLNARLSSREGDSAFDGIPGRGSSIPALLVIGDGPDFEERASSRPFSGESGEFLGKWLSNIGLGPDDVYFLTLPAQGDHETALRSLLEDFSVCLDPRALLVLGGRAGGLLLGAPPQVDILRGRRHDVFGRPLIVTHHPRVVLQNPDLKRPVWEDLKRLKGILDYAG